MSIAIFYVSTGPPNIVRMKNRLLSPIVIEGEISSATAASDLCSLSLTDVAVVDCCGILQFQRRFRNCHWHSSTASRAPRLTAAMWSLYREHSFFCAADSATSFDGKAVHRSRVDPRTDKSTGLPTCFRYLVHATPQYNVNQHLYTCYFSFACFHAKTHCVSKENGRFTLSSLKTSQIANWFS